MIMRQRVLCALIAVMLAVPFAVTHAEESADVSENAKILYVAENGSDAAAGTQSAPLATISRAVTLADAGTTILVGDGEYLGRVSIQKEGRPDAWITIRAENPRGAFVNGGFSIDGGAYIEIDGFICEDPSKLGTAVGVGQGPEPTNKMAHHINVFNCVLRNSGQSGFSSAYADYMHIKGNEIYGNSRLSEWQGSGLSLWENRAFDQQAGYHNIIENNIIYDNLNAEDVVYVNGTAEEGHTDGNGIIIDYGGGAEFGNTADPKVDENPLTLIRGNLCFDNGGRGIGITYSSNCHIINNTLYRNAKDEELISAKSELSVNIGNNLIVRNNIIYATMGNECIGMGNGTNNIFENNLCFNGSVVGEGKGNLIGVNPRFVNASIQPDTADFRLKADSPAIDMGADVADFPLDMDGNPRKAGAAIDAGCYEFTGEAAEHIIEYDIFREGISLKDWGIERGLVAHYTLDTLEEGKITDELGGSSGVIHGGVSLVEGRKGMALDFNGTDSYVTIEPGAALKPTNSVTVSTWIKVTAPLPDYRKAVWMGDATVYPWGAYGLEFLWPERGDNLLPGFHVSTNGGYNKAESPDKLELNRWQYVTGVYTNTCAYIYVDGELKGTKEISGKIGNYENAILALGGDSAGGGIFTGQLDDVKIFARALSPNDVKNLYLDACGETVEQVNMEDNLAVTVAIDGLVVGYDQPPILQNDVTYVPVRKTFEAVGLNVDWDGSTQTVTITGQNTNIMLTVGQQVGTINGVEYALEAAAILKDGRVLVPLRFVAEGAGCDVDWYEDTGLAMLTKRPVDNTQQNTTNTPTEHLNANLYTNAQQSALSLAKDGDETTCWSSGFPIRKGMYLEIELPHEQSFQKLKLNQKKAQWECPGTFDVYISNDGIRYGDPVMTGLMGTQGASTIIQFPRQQRAQYIKLVMSDSAEHQWSVSEINLE